MSSGDGRRGHMSLETSYFSSRNRGGYHSRYVVRGGYMSKTSHYSYYNPGDRGRFLSLYFSSRCVDENVHEKDKGNISFYDGNGRINRCRDDGEPRGDIIVDDV